MNVVPIKSIIKSLLIINLRLTPKRIANMIKIFTSMLFSRLTRRQIVWGYPLFLMVEPTNICNLKCPMCPSGNGEMSRALGKLNFENYKRLLDDVGDRVLQVQLWNQGEPLINKSLLDFVRYAKGKGIVTQTSTNGHYIRTEEAAEEIVLSGLDAQRQRKPVDHRPLQVRPQARALHQVSILSAVGRSSGFVVARAATARWWLIV